MTLVYRMDNEPDVYYLATVFESKEAYVANADSPEQNDRRSEIREVIPGLFHSAEAARAPRRVPCSRAG